MKRDSATPTLPDKQNNHDLHLFGINGVIWHFTQREFFGMYFSRIFLVPYILFLALIMAFKPAAFEGELSTMQRLVFWALLLPGYLLAFQAVATLLCRINRRLKLARAVPSVLIHIVLTPLFMFSAVSLVGMLTAHPGSAWLLGWPDYLRFYVIVILFEALYIFFLLPRSGYREAVNLPETTPGPKPCLGKRTVELAGEPVMLDKINFVKSVEHYLEVDTGSGEPMLVRMSMRDFLSRLPPDAGIQPHRSWWVSRTAADRIVSGNGRKMFRLIDGREVPIARSRLREVMAWQADNG